jgi:hypothetical protein
MDGYRYATASHTPNCAFQCKHTGTTPVKQLPPSLHQHRHRKSVARRLVKALNENMEVDQPTTSSLVHADDGVTHNHTHNDSNVLPFHWRMHFACTGVSSVHAQHAYEKHKKTLIVAGICVL